MARITRDSIEKAIESKYENTVVANDEDVTLFTLRAPLRMPDKDRKRMADLWEEQTDFADKQKAAAEAEEDVPDWDQLGFWRKFLLVIADNKSACEAWLEEVGDDLGFLTQVVEIYFAGVKLGDSEVGEASPSES